MLRNAGLGLSSPTVMSQRMIPVDEPQVIAFPDVNGLAVGCRRDRDDAVVFAFMLLDDAVWQQPFGQEQMAVMLAGDGEIPHAGSIFHLFVERFAVGAVRS